MNICFDAKIVSQERIDIGKIKSAVFDPKHGEVTHVVVHKGIFFPHDTLIPMSLVQGNDNNEVLLQVNSDEIGDLPKYFEGMFHTGPGGSQEVAETPAGERFGVEEPPDRAEGLRKAIHFEPGSIEINKDTEVQALDGKVGMVACLQVDQYTNHLTYVVVGKNNQINKEVAVPVEYIFKVESGKISLSVPRMQALQGPPPPAGPYIPVEPEQEELHE